MPIKAHQVKQQELKNQKYPYPSRYGSHTSMINSEKTLTLHNTTNKKGDNVILTDEFGDYVTEAKRLDNGLADANRFSLQKRKVSLS